MTDIVVWCASYLLWVLVAGFAAIWWLAEDRRGKVTLALAAVLGVAVVGVLILVAGALHTDPRPFVANPSIHPLIAHAPDNGFPSDHSAAAGLIATLIALRHRWYGAAMAIGAVAIAAARVAAHVHHVQDVAAGLALGAVAALVAYAAARAITAWLAHRPDTAIGRLARIPAEPAAARSGTH